MGYSYLPYLFVGYTAFVAIVVIVTVIVGYVIRQAQYRALNMPEHAKKAELKAIFLPLGR